MHDENEVMVLIKSTSEQGGFVTCNRPLRNVSITAATVNSAGAGMLV